MLALVKKEINSFFGSPVGYLVISVFLILNGLFLWVFSGDLNIFDNGFADLTPFFEMAPWVFVFLIPAITMRSFSEEKRMGTLELLLTKPISIPTIVLGKYFGAMFLVLLALVPTIIYVLTISDLGNPPHNLDIGSTLGSYLGLIFLGGAYTGIGLFTSSLSENQVVAFILAVLICFTMFYGFEGISSINTNLDVSFLGLQAHYKSIARGLIDTRDVLYFLSIASFFLMLTYIKLNNN